MNQEILDNIQTRLENCANVANDKAFEIARIRNMKYGINNAGRFPDAEIAEIKTQVKTDITALIGELSNINNLIQ